MLDTLKAFYNFSFSPAYLENMIPRFDGEKTKYQRGFPTRLDMENCRGLGFTWCNLFWFTPGYSAVAIDHLNLDRILR